ncbi:hypothetical protein [Cytobacillus sp. SAFR-174]|uniref:hypothetical protein n=1 Tax=Cytobacillus sp. SAFR-174 TaxID=3436868 RepID=UPI003F80778D
MEILGSPNTNDIELYLNKNTSINDKTLHLVPTMILYQRRANFYRKLLKSKNIDMPVFHRLKDKEINSLLRKNGIFLFEINRFFEEMVNSNSEIKSTLLSRRETTIILERVLKANPVTNNHVWLVLIPKLYDFFQNLLISGTPLKELKSYSSNNSWGILLSIFEDYVKHLKENNYLDYGLAWCKAIKVYDLKKFDKVYIDGAFLPVQPGLHKLIKTLNDIGSEIKFFVPIDLEKKDSPAFKVIKKTYSQYVDINDWKSINFVKQDHNVVQKLARNLFTNETIIVDDPSFEIIEFETLEEEFTSIVQRISTFIKRDIVKPHKVAIITPNPMEMRPFVRELAELYDLKCDLPPRALVHLPYGKFIYLLFQIKTDDRINTLVQADHFIDKSLVSELLYQNIYKESQEVLSLLEQLQAFFEDSRTFNEWYNQLSMLKEARRVINEDFRNHPLYYISENQLDQFQLFISLIENISRKVVNNAIVPFQKHLSNLLTTLSEEEHLYKPNEDIVDRINEIKDIVELDDKLNINGEEFGSKIQSIFKDDNFQEEEYPSNQVKITVTGPNNVEFQEYDMIFLTRFTQNMYPEKIHYKWPMSMEVESILIKSNDNKQINNSSELFNFYLDRSLYHLFTVLNSVSKKLTISYSKRDNGLNQSVSHYLHDIAKVFNIEEDIQSEKSIEDVLKESNLLLNPSSRPFEYSDYTNENIIGQSIKEGIELSIEDIAVYEYCPKRFFYEKQFPNQRAFQSVFHIQNYASACLYERGVINLVDKFPRISKENKKVVLLEIENILDESKMELYGFFPLGQRYWEDIKIRAGFHLEELIKKVLNNTEHNAAELSIGGQKVVKKLNGYNFVGERELKVKYPTVTHYYSISNLKDLQSFSINTLDQEELNNHKRVKELYYELLRGFCYGSNQTNQKLALYAEKINNNSFEKNPGGHCIYCSFKHICMEKEIQFNAAD